MVTDPDEVFTLDPVSGECGRPLAGAPVFGIRRQQVFDAPAPPPRPRVTEYRFVARVCPCRAATTSDPAPAGVTGRISYGPGLLARAVWLRCGQFLQVRRVAAALAAPVGGGLDGLRLLAAGPGGPAAQDRVPATRARAGRRGAGCACGRDHRPRRGNPALPAPQMHQHTLARVGGYARTDRNRLRPAAGDSDLADLAEVAPGR